MTLHTSHQLNFPRVLAGSWHMPRHKPGEQIGLSLNFSKIPNAARSFPLRARKCAEASLKFSASVVIRHSEVAAVPALI